MTVQLHLGCGKRYIPGFIHIDLDDFPHIDHRSRIDRLPMFPDETADLIYCCHGLEYFDRIEAPEVLREWHRVLRKGGILRVSVPDFSALISVYENTGNLNAILGPLYGRMAINTEKGDAVIYHRTAYDYRSLEELCLTVGFRSVCRYDWRKTIHKDYDDYSQAYLPHMDKDGGLLISLNIEAQK
ncbi:MAG: methyltransferase domain-containing protein [Betaproteobacteria bacterium]|nr:methyltransferase domain-containing protein [Betaproteobacteria bacterium]